MRALGLCFLFVSVAACGGKVVVDNETSTSSSTGTSSGSGNTQAACDAVPGQSGTCVSSNPCNPVTNSGCQSDEACDIGTDGFQCFPGNTEMLCDSCDNKKGPYCLPGMTCLDDGHCAQYCCNDSNCGSGSCDMNVLPGTGVGVCED